MKKQLWMFYIQKEDRSYHTVYVYAATLSGAAEAVEKNYRGCPVTQITPLPTAELIIVGFA